MNEKDKMLNGELYMPDSDETLFNERIKCKTLCHQYNNLSPNKLDINRQLKLDNFDIKWDMFNFMSH